MGVQSEALLLSRPSDDTINVHTGAQNPQTRERLCKAR